MLDFVCVSVCMYVQTRSAICRMLKHWLSPAVIARGLLFLFCVTLKDFQCLPLRGWLGEYMYILPSPSSLIPGPWFSVLAMKLFPRLAGFFDHLCS